MKVRLVLDVMVQCKFYRLRLLMVIYRFQAKVRLGLNVMAHDWVYGLRLGLMAKFNVWVLQVTVQC